MNAYRLRRLSRLRDDELCRRLTLEGWEHLAGVDDTPGGLVLAVPGQPSWPLVLAAVGLYRGPVAIVIAGADRSRDLPAVWRERFAGALHPPATALEPALAALADGARVLVVTPPGDESDGLAGDLARRGGTPIVSLEARAESRGRYRVSVVLKC